MKINKNNRVLILDFDGVLATTNQFYTNRKKWNPIYKSYRFDDKCVRVLNKIIEVKNPTIVVSSDWKLTYDIGMLNKIFEINGINATVADVTVDLWETVYKSYQQLEECRANEILQYVNEHELVNYVVIDDLNLTPWIPDNFVHCKHVNEGIKQSGIKDKIINILN
jgi:hypothetical protein